MCNVASRILKSVPQVLAIRSFLQSDAPAMAIYGDDVYMCTTWLNNNEERLEKIERRRRAVVEECCSSIIMLLAEQTTTITHYYKHTFRHQYH